ncbi:MAG: glycosyltransferase [Lentisphaeria bacterium]|nr:glycosyltransferase [Candidatus Neomarinimicrobiota bacterium]MCF7842691.1 glycosyltransferase [Lentisphaeria bacterium]
MQLTIIIVNYNVKAFLQQALHSLYNSLTGISAEIIVVDNNSVDGSLQMLASTFPDVKVISNDKNLGFAKANNQALKISRGQYVWLLNPDTLVQEDTPAKLIAYMETHPKVGLCGCKILNADGSLQLACRRKFPTPWVSFTKLSDLAKLFPKSKLFGQYNLTYLDPDEETVVDAVSGSCMFARRDAVDAVGFLDEDFFMYGEDLDWAYRFHAADWEVRYTPITSIVHYKGESSKYAGWDALGNFYRAMDIFARKHFRGLFWRPLHWMLRLGIFVRYMGSVIGRFSQDAWPVVVDVVGILGMMALSILVKFYKQDAFTAYVIIASVYLLVWLLSFRSVGLYNRYRYSISRAIVAVGLGFLFNVTLTFFFKQFAFSRQVLILVFVGIMIWVPGWRILAGRRTRRRGSSPLDFRKTLIVGDLENARHIYSRLNTHLEYGYQPVGIVMEKRGTGEEDSKVLGDLSDLPDLILIHNIREVIFASEQINLKQLFRYIPQLGKMGVNFRLVPGNLTFIIGKSSVEDIRDIQLVDMRFDYFRPWNRVMKRLGDLALTLLLSLSWWPITAIQARLKKFDKHSTLSSAFLWDSGKQWGVVKERLPMLREVWQGKMSLVGAPIDLTLDNDMVKPGIVSLEDIRQSNQLEENERIKLLNYYLHNQSFLFDLEILLKAISGQ